MATATPHDALFKAAFETPRDARALLTEILPAQLRAAIAWGTLARESGTFIDPTLASRHSDLLFSVELADEPALVYVLLEHQSEVDHKLPLRMAEYLVRVWKRFDKQYGLPLPPIIPVIMGHPQRGWTGPTSLHELVQPQPASVPGLEPRTLGLSLIICDLQTVDDAQLRDWALQAFPKLALLLLRDARDLERLDRAFRRWRELFLEVLHADGGADAVSQVLHYIATVVGEVRFEEFRATLTKQLPQLDDAAMTIAEELHQRGHQQGLREGLQEGLQKGLQKGRAEQLSKMARLKFGELEPAALARIEAASIEELDRYSERILSAESIEEFLDQPRVSAKGV